MSLDVGAIEREYSIKRMNAIKINEEKIKDLYDSSPELNDISSNIRKLGIEASRCALSQTENKRKEELLKEIEELKKKKESILSKKGVSLVPSYECEKCKDTGYIKNGVYSTMCSCMKQHLINYYYNKFNTFKLSEETFENFDESLYSDSVNKEKYKVSISPRENINKIKKLSLDFIKNFENDETKSLLFTGTAGTGKTFLSGAIANKVLENQHTVLYQTAPLLMDSIFEFKYGNKTSMSKELYENLFDVDLLIIDDLGTESQSQAKFQELFNIINTRILNPKKKTIISTNLNLSQLSKLYDDRIVSRLIGKYNICKFFGDDIRTK